MPHASHHAPLDDRSQHVPFAQADTFAGEHLDLDEASEPVSPQWWVPKRFRRAQRSAGSEESSSEEATDWPHTASSDVPAPPPRRDTAPVAREEEEDASSPGEMRSIRERLAALMATYASPSRHDHPSSATQSFLSSCSDASSPATTPPHDHRHYHHRADVVPIPVSPRNRRIVRDELAEGEVDSRRRVVRRRLGACSDAAGDVDQLTRRGRGQYAPHAHFNGLASIGSSQLTLGSLNGNMRSTHAMHIYRTGVRETCGVDPACLHDGHHYRRHLAWPVAQLMPPSVGVGVPQPATATTRDRHRQSAPWNSSTCLSSTETATATSQAVASALYRTGSPQRARARIHDEDLFDHTTGVSLKATEIPMRYFARWAPHRSAHTLLTETPIVTAGSVAAIARGEGVMETRARSPRRAEWAYHDGPAPYLTHRDAASGDHHAQVHRDERRRGSTPPHSRERDNRHLPCTAPRHVHTVASREAIQTRASRQEAFAVAMESALGTDACVRPSAIAPSQWRVHAAISSDLSRPLHDAQPAATGRSPTTHAADDSNSAASFSQPSPGERAPPARLAPSHTIGLQVSRSDGLVNSRVAAEAAAPGLDENRRRRHTERHTRRRPPLASSSPVRSPLDPAVRSDTEAARAPRRCASDVTHKQLSPATRVRRDVEAESRRVLPFPPLLTPLLQEVDECLHAHALGSLRDIWRASPSTQERLLQAVGFSHQADRKTILWELERMIRNTSSTCDPGF